RLIDPDGKQISALEMRFLRDPALGGWSSYQNNLKAYQQGGRVGAGIAAGVLAIGAAASTVPYVIGTALSNPVTTNEIGIAITEALSPGAENVTAGAASKVANIGDDVSGAATKLKNVADDITGATVKELPQLSGSAEQKLLPEWAGPWGNKTLFELPDPGWPPAVWPPQQIIRASDIKPGWLVHEFGVISPRGTFGIVVEPGKGVHVNKLFDWFPLEK
ncbi:MAG: hypothetical protein ACREBU_17025, partial [Nitrososphaera sp.]